MVEGGRRRQPRDSLEWLHVGVFFPANPKTSLLFISTRLQTEASASRDETFGTSIFDSRPHAHHHHRVYFRRPKSTRSSPGYVWRDPEFSSDLSFLSRHLKKPRPNDLRSICFPFPVLFPCQTLLERLHLPLSLATPRPNRTFEHFHLQTLQQH